MNRILVCAFLMTCIALVGFAQNKISSTRKKIAYQNGFITLEAYSKHCFKLVYKPENYAHNENYTQAVIAEVNQHIPIPFKQVLDTLQIGPVKLVDAPMTEEYKGFRFLLSEGEKIYGGGERAIGLNRRGKKLSLYNNPWYGYSEGADALNFSVPFFTSNKGYALFFDNGSKGYADIGHSMPNLFEVGFCSGELNVFIILGDSYAQILNQFHALTGKQPLPPAWALGNLMSRFGYSSEEQLNSIIEKTNQQGIPFDGVIFDLFWFGDSIKGTMGNLDWVNKQKWPNPKAMLQTLNKNNHNPVLITEPFFLQQTKAYEASLPYLATNGQNQAFMINDFYFGVGGLLDIFRKDAAEWIWNYHYKKQIELGVKGWWTDLGEPEKHPADMQHNLSDYGIKRKLLANEVHNVYGHYWNKNLFEKYTQHYPNQRLFHLNRSGFAGSQRYSIFPWTGDVSRSWSGLKAQLPNLLGMSMSGIPYCHSDAGGFAGGEGDAELYVRWLQLALYSPIFRPHGTALYEIDKNAFSYPSEPALFDEPYLTTIKKIVNKRYLLFPYIYTLAFEQALHGKPLMQPYYFNYANDANAEAIEDAYFFGDNILVAPITEKQATTKKIYLPEGEWYDELTDSVFSGKQWIEKEINPKQFDLPVFVKAGSCVPQYTSVNKKEAALQITYYPSLQKSKPYTLYTDDGEGKHNIDQLKYASIICTPSTTAHQLQLTIKTERPQFVPSQIAQKPFIMAIPLLNKKVKQVQVNQITAKQKTGTSTTSLSYEVKNNYLYIYINNCYKTQQHITVNF